MSPDSNLPDPERTTYLIDASIYIFRAWFGVPDHFFDDRGRPMNAVYGYAAFLLKFLSQARPNKVMVAFDESLFTGYRHQLYTDYKANRALPDDALAFQLQTCKAITEWFGMGIVASPVYEADDLIASVAKKRRQQGDRVVVLSTDKDLAQIIGPKDWLWDFHGQKWLDHSALEALWGFPVARIAAYLAVVGDSIDNIPGIPGVGARTGQRLFAHYEDLDVLYRDIESVASLGMRGSRQLIGRLVQHEDDARLFYQLTLLRDTAKCRWGNNAVKLKRPDKSKLYNWWLASGLTRTLRLDKYLANYE